MSQQEELSTSTLSILQRAKAAAAGAAFLSTAKKNQALFAMAQALRDDAQQILLENQADLQAAQGRVAQVMLDRLALNTERIANMAQGLESLAALEDPVGRTLSEHTTAQGLQICKVSVPIGVIAIIYESRPNVTSDAAALAFKSGNVCVLRSGKEAYRSAAAIVRSMRRALSEIGMDENMINLIQDTTRASATALMRATEYIDLLIPRGGAGLIRACV